MDWTQNLSVLTAKKITMDWPWNPWKIHGFCESTRTPQGLPGGVISPRPSPLCYFPLVVWLVPSSWNGGLGKEELSNVTILFFKEKNYDLWGMSTMAHPQLMSLWSRSGCCKGNTPTLHAPPPTLARSTTDDRWQTHSVTDERTPSLMNTHRHSRTLLFSHLLLSHSPLLRAFSPSSHFLLLSSFPFCMLVPHTWHFVY